MAPAMLSNDPYNIIITGVGGQGNVLASRMVGDMLLESGLVVTIGETFGASQRGGSVMSHMRVSASTFFSPQIPRGLAHMIVSLEPTEAIRVLKDYGNPQVKVISNTRPNPFHRCDLRRACISFRRRYRKIGQGELSQKGLV